MTRNSICAASLAFLGLSSLVQADDVGDSAIRFEVRVPYDDRSAFDSEHAERQIRESGARICGNCAWSMFGFPQLVREQTDLMVIIRRANEPFWQPYSSGWKRTDYRRR